MHAQATEVPHNTMLTKLEHIKRATGLEGSAADVDKMATALGLTLTVSGLVGKVDELHSHVFGEALAEASPSRVAQQLRSEVAAATAPSKTVITLRGAAEESAANAALLAKLTVLDDQLVAALKRSDVRLMRRAWLLAQPEGYRMQRRQALEELERGGASPSPLLSPDEAVQLIRRGDRSVGVLSYGECVMRARAETNLHPSLTARAELDSLSRARANPGWNMPNDPDPTGKRIVAVREALRAFPHIEALFWECVCSAAKRAQL